MREFSPQAWSIASLYSHILASETRDLAAQIDAALLPYQNEVAGLNSKLAALGLCDPHLLDRTLRERDELREQLKAAKGEITKLAADLHRSKWKFDSGEHRLSAVEARNLVNIAFNELQRIGDIAIKARDSVTQG